METKFIWVVHFEEADFSDLDCAFDNFEKAKEAVQTIFDKVSAVNPAWQNLMLDDEEAILFDDDARVRRDWNLGGAIDPTNTDIFEVLKEILSGLE